jgi:hypothetical protein
MHANQPAFKSQAARRATRLSCSFLAIVLVATPVGGQARLYDGVPTPSPASFLERVFSETTIGTSLGVVPGWLGLVLLALIPAALTITLWLWWTTRIASDPSLLAGRRLAWALKLTTRERRVIDRLAQAARTEPAAVLMVQHAYDRGLAHLPESTRDDRRIRTAAAELRSRLFSN